MHICSAICLSVPIKTSGVPSVSFHCIGDRFCANGPFSFIHAAYESRASRRDRRLCAMPKTVRRVWLRQSI